LKVISSQYPVISGPKAGRQLLLITDPLITDYFSPTDTIMKLKLFFLGLAALVQMSCQSDVGNTTGQPQSAGEPQDSGVMPMENGPSSRPLGESMH